MVSHDPVAASYADRILVIADGRIVGDHPSLSPQQIADLLISLEVAVMSGPGRSLVLGLAPRARHGGTWSPDSVARTPPC